MQIILHNEWLGLLRSKWLVTILVLFGIALTLVTWLSTLQNKQQAAAQIAAQKHIRNQWDSMKPTNPHSAAHYGSYAFKPINALSSLDAGVLAVTGNVIRLEGHGQNEAAYTEAAQSVHLSKFGKLLPAVLLQYLLPLWLLFLSFSSYTSEKKHQRIKLLVIQGTPLGKLLLAKIISIWSIGLLLLLLSTVTQLVSIPTQYNADVLNRLLLLYTGYGLYYFIIIAFTIWVSVVAKTNTAALAFTVAAWVLWTIFLPQIIGNAVEKTAPLPTRIAFQKAMEEDRSKGIDGHNPAGDRQKELEKATLAKYGVDSLAALPINFDGIVMQADEEYGNTVWDKHFGQLYKQLQVQKNTYQLSGFINPFASLQGVSMGAAGTDMVHHVHFLKEAENYRRVFIKTLNDKHAFGGSKTGDWDWKPPADFFSSIKDFSYQTPSYRSFWKNYWIDIALLTLWSTVLALTILFTAKRVSIV